jgi:hypothetical protein
LNEPFALPLPPPIEVIVLNTEFAPLVPTVAAAPVPPAPTVTVIADPEETDNPVPVK